MRVLNDFKCSDCGALEEALENREVREIRCKTCNGTAQRVRTVPKFCLDGTDPGYPDAYDKWAKDHEQGAKIHP